MFRANFRLSPRSQLLRLLCYTTLLPSVRVIIPIAAAGDDFLAEPVVLIVEVAELHIRTDSVPNVK